VSFCSAIWVQPLRVDRRPSNSTARHIFASDSWENRQRVGDNDFIDFSGFLD
jgi:hypothetical protein